MTSAKILIVDDEAPIIDMLSYNLERAHYDVLVAWDGKQAIDLARRERPDLIVLDLMLPEIDGLDVCRTLRRERDVPIIMLTARDEEVDRVVGLELGADDYMVKPFSVRELLARIKNVLRRTRQTGVQAEYRRTHVGALAVDSARREASFLGQALDLTTLEFELLCTLASQPARVFEREQLLREVWGYEYVENVRVVDAVVKRLRAKLRAVAPDREPIETVRGIGYKLVAH